MPWEILAFRSRFHAAVCGAAAFAFAVVLTGAGMLRHRLLFHLRVLFRLRCHGRIGSAARWLWLIGISRSSEEACGKYARSDHGLQLLQGHGSVSFHVFLS